MIKVCFFNINKKICGFEVKNHGRDIVCSAVSILTLNTCNSIEKYTNDKFQIEYNDEGGFLKFILKDLKNISNEATLILNCLELGLKGIESEYSKDIKIKYKEV